MLIILLNIFFQLSSASQARQTVPGIAAHLCPTGISPRPTAAPALFPQRDLLKRQNVAVCAYGDGGPVTCVKPGDACATNAYYSAAGCCAGGIFSDCALPTTCVNSFDLSGCEPNCLSDYLALSCTNVIYPSCATFLFVNGGTYTGYGCAVLGAVYPVTPLYQIPIQTFDAGVTTAVPNAVPITVSVTVTGGGSDNNNGGGDTISGTGNAVNNGGGSINIYNNEGTRRYGGGKGLGLVVLSSCWMVWLLWDWVHLPDTML